MACHENEDELFVVFKGTFFMILEIYDTEEK